MHQKVVDIWGIYLCHVWLCRDWELKCASRRLTWYDIGGLVSCRTTPCWTCCPFPPHTLTGPSAQIHHMWHWKNVTRRHHRMRVCYTYDNLMILYVYYMDAYYTWTLAHTHRSYPLYSVHIPFPYSISLYLSLSYRLHFSFQVAHNTSIPSLVPLLIKDPPQHGFTSTKVKLISAKLPSAAFSAGDWLWSEATEVTDGSQGVEVGAGNARGCFWWKTWDFTN